MLFDLGLSSFQLADTDRGFGIRAGGPLDMRFDTSRGVPAADLLATLDADELTALFKRFGEEPNARRIARAIVDARRTAPVTTAEDLAALVERVSPAGPRGRRRIHPATRVFQALRIAVNEELDALQDGLAAAVDLLRPGGRLVVSVPLARGPHRQALPRRRAEGLHLPARAPGLRLRPDAPSSPRHPAVDHPDGTPRLPPTRALGVPACGPPSASPPDQRPGTKRRSHREQATPVQPSSFVRSPPARVPRACGTSALPGVAGARVRRARCDLLERSIRLHGSAHAALPYVLGD